MFCLSGCQRYWASRVSNKVSERWKPIWESGYAKPHHHKIAGVSTLAQGQGVCTIHIKFYVNAAHWNNATEMAFANHSGENKNTIQLQHFTIPYSLQVSFCFLQSFQLPYKALFSHSVGTIYLPFTFRHFNWINVQPYHEIVVGARMVNQEYLSQHLGSPPVLAD